MKVRILAGVTLLVGVLVGVIRLFRKTPIPYYDDKSNFVGDAGPLA